LQLPDAELASGKSKVGQGISSSDQKVAVRLLKLMFQAWAKRGTGTANPNEVVENPRWRTQSAG